MRRLRHAWDEFSWAVCVLVYGFGRLIMRPFIRSIGGDYWVYCVRCGGTIHPLQIPTHARRHRDEREQEVDRETRPIL